VIQLVVQNGSQAGCHRVARRFPFQVGRSPRSHLPLADEGVWPAHATICFQAGEGYFLQAEPEALTRVNGERVARIRLRNGDLIECGSVRLRFWLAALRQRGLWLREAMTWIGLGCLCLLQLGLVYWLVG
jgi:hypothetical protein